MLFKPLLCSENAFFRTFVFSVLVLLFSGSAVSCKKEKDYSREEYILVADAPDAEMQAQARILLPIEGAAESEPKVLYVWSNVDYEISFQTDDDAEDWIRILDRRYNAELGADEIRLSVAPMKDSYLQRSGTLSLKRPDIYLNHFVRLVQGYPSRIGSDFDWLQYGSDNPLSGMEGKLISLWTQSEKDYGWTSTPSEESGIAYCYGRDGFIQLGDAEGHSADLITPYSVNLRRDTVIMAAFNAVAYKSLTETDSAELTVEVAGGGQFLDGTKSKTLTVTHMDPMAQDIPEDMWDGTYYGYTIIGTRDNPLTGDTHIRLLAGSPDKSNGTRIFIDNFNVLTISREWWDLLFDEYPWEQTE